MSAELLKNLGNFCKTTGKEAVSFDCICGGKHSVDIGNIILGENTADKILEEVADFRGKKLFLMADTTTYEILGRHVEKLLLGSGCNLKTFVFETNNLHLVPDERALGRLAVEVKKDTDLIITVGSGVLNDLAKFTSYKAGIPYIVVATAPSMDGYASVVSPFIIGGVKITCEGKYPYAIIGDTGILKEAPMEMLQAGFGDIIGKLTALADWELAREKGKEGYCETIAQLVRDALNKCIDNVNGIAGRDKNAIEYLMEGLILSGITIGLYGDSRPASGSEHSFAHYWDMDAVSMGKSHPLHGISVGVGTVVISCIYELMKPHLPENINFPKPERVKELLSMLDCCDNPRDLGISRDLFIESMHRISGLKTRYTIMNLAEEKGVLEEITEILTKKFYG